MMTDSVCVFWRGTGFAHAILDKSNDLILRDNPLIMILASGGHHSVKDRDNARCTRCYKLVEATERCFMNEDQHISLPRSTNQFVQSHSIA